METIYRIFSGKIRKLLQSLHLELAHLQEIRLRVNAPLLLLYKNQEYMIDRDGQMAFNLSEPYRVTPSDMEEMVGYISNFSLYAYEDEIRQGFLTIHGGHRVGLAGKVIVDGGHIKNLQYITFMNIRISHQVKNCARKILPYIISGHKVEHTLFISPPGCGKTTMLRDLVRLLSNGDYGLPGLNIGVVDERSEIGACYQGIPQNDLGIRTDILDCCPKSEGMMMLVRSMSPQVIAVDEIGGREDISALEYVMNCGCQVIATIHGHSVEEVKQKSAMCKLIEEKAFQRYVVLDNNGTTGHVAQIFDAQGNLLLGRNSAKKELPYHSCIT